MKAFSSTFASCKTSTRQDGGDPTKFCSFLWDHSFDVGADKERSPFPLTKDILQFSHLFISHGT